MMRVDEHEVDFEQVSGMVETDPEVGKSIVRRGGYELTFDRPVSVPDDRTVVVTSDAGRTYTFQDVGRTASCRGNQLHAFGLRIDS